MFSIIIPTFNNIRYLKICIESIKKNSEFNHEIIPTSDHNYHNIRRQTKLSNLSTG